MGYRVMCDPIKEILCSDKRQLSLREAEAGHKYRADCPKNGAEVDL